MAAITKAQLQSQLDSQVQANEAKGPIYSAKELGKSEQPFQQKVGEWFARFVAEQASLRSATQPKEVRRRTLLENHLPVLGWLLPMHDAAHRRFDETSAAYDVAVRSQVVYTTEQRLAATALADEIIRLRTAGSDVTGDGSDASKVLRDGLRIGVPINRANPHEVKAEGAAVLLSLNGLDETVQGAAADASRQKSKALRDGLEARGVILEAFVPDIEAAAEELFQKLESGIATRKSDARVDMQKAQLELEQINDRILATANALGGIAARNELRALLPTTTQSPPTVAAPETPTEPGPVASGPDIRPPIPTKPVFEA